MKKIILMLITVNMLFAWGDSIKEKAKKEAQTVCIGGYLFAITTVHNGNGISVAMVQIMAKDSNDNSFPMHPIKCKK